jgi:hypothetical protein
VNARNELHANGNAIFGACRIATLIAIFFCIGNAQNVNGWDGKGETQAGALQLDDTNGGVRLRWQRDNAAAMMLSSTHEDAPAYAEVLTFEAFSAPALVIDAIDAAPLKQTATITVALPAAPATIIRTGTLNGKHYIVVGISPIYQRDGVTMAAAAFTAQLQGARQIEGIDPNVVVEVEAANVPPPATHPADTWRIAVAAQGIQRISGTQWAAAGVPMDSIPVGQLHVKHHAVEIDIDVIDADANGVLGMADEVRFYAIQPGDRWNQTDTYWLTLSPQAGARMATQAQTQAGALTRTAMTEGVWERDSMYDSRLPGPDEDHWFSAKLNADHPAMDATLHSSLPLAGGNVQVTVNGSSAQPAAVRVASDGVTAEHDPSPMQGSSRAAPGDWAYGFTLPAASGSTDMSVQVSSKGDGMALEDVSWRAPVSLSFRQMGAAFDGMAGTWTYQLESVPAGAALYDVTDWQHPLKIPLDAALRFNAGPAARKYVLAGVGTLFEPAISKRESADLSKPINARAVYIAPAALHAALQPLIAHRLVNGWRASIIDTQAIYDGWSNGQISPDAIRNFLRHARATWRVKPYAVILVGDGNYDPLNHSGDAAPTLVPPFLANVDPRMGETACESCYAQLDGDDALSDSLPDLLFGRLPVKSAEQLSALVDKIIAYETQSEGAWMQRVAFIADNTRHADGSYDNAGDFDAFTRRGMALQPAGVALPALFYEPLADVAQPQYEADALAAHNKVITLLNEGAAVVNFTGHGLTNQWAYTAPNAGSPPYLLTSQDAALLNNGARLPVALSMACLTGSFHLPSAGGNSIDEQLVLAPNGGAIASWSSAGLSILYSSEWIQRGFYKALWQNPGAITMGALAQASLLELFQNAPCCDEPLRTHALLGDPLTPLRINALPARLYLPAMTR